MENKGGIRLMMRYVDEEFDATKERLISGLTSSKQRGHAVDARQIADQMSEQIADQMSEQIADQINERMTMDRYVREMNETLDDAKERLLAKLMNNFNTNQSGGGERGRERTRNERQQKHEQRQQYLYQQQQQQHQQHQQQQQYQQQQQQPHFYREQHRHQRQQQLYQRYVYERYSQYHQQQQQRQPSIIETTNDFWGTVEDLKVRNRHMTTSASPQRRASSSPPERNNIHRNSMRALLVNVFQREVSRDQGIYRGQFDHGRRDEKFKQGESKSNFFAT